MSVLVKVMSVLVKVMNVSVKVMSVLVKVMNVSVKVMSVSVKVMSVSVKVMCVSVKVMCISVKVMSVLVKVMFVLVKVISISYRKLFNRKLFLFLHLTIINSFCSFQNAYRHIVLRGWIFNACYNVKMLDDVECAIDNRVGFIFLNRTCQVEC